MSAILEQLRAATRPHQCVADADRIAFVDHRPGADGYSEYLVRALGYELPVESALSATPGLLDVLDVAARASSRILTRELVALGFQVEDLLEIEHCKIAMLGSLAEACGWLYVAWRNRSSHDLLRTLVARRHPEAVLWRPRHDEHIPAAEWDALSRFLDSVVDEAGARSIIDAAIRAYDSQHFWFRGSAASGTAFALVAKVAEQRLRKR